MILKNKKAIVLKDVNTRLSIPTDGVIFKAPQDQQDSKQYYQDKIKELQESNRELIEAVKLVESKIVELKYLKEFRDMFAGHCIAHNVMKTVIQCTVTIRKGACNFHNTCNERKKWNRHFDI